MQDQIEYYQKRATEYEIIYQKPERQRDLSELKNLLEQQFSDQSILEIACGTGFWTECISKQATSVLATDINNTVLEIAKQKSYQNLNITFRIEDLRELPSPSIPYDALFGGFIWSHILKQELDNFFNKCLEQISTYGQLVFIDNKYVKNSNTPISRTDEHGNTFQTRKLKSGETFEVLKTLQTIKN